MREAAKWHFFPGLEYPELPRNLSSRIYFKCHLPTEIGTAVRTQVQWQARVT